MKDEDEIDEILGDVMPGEENTGPDDDESTEQSHSKNESASTASQPDNETEILGTTKIARRWRISLIKQVREELGEGGESIEIGDRIVLRKSGGKIVIESA